MQTKEQRQRRKTQVCTHVHADPKKIQITKVVMVQAYIRSNATTQKAELQKSHNGIEGRHPNGRTARSFNAGKE
jgi:hypothetical protein